MMEADEDDKAAGEILRSLLSIPKNDCHQNFENQSWQDLGDNCQSSESIVWQIEPTKPETKDSLQNNENIIQHIPVTYLTADNRNLTLANGKTIAKPVTYVLSRNVIGETPCAIQENQLNDSQKIVLVQQIDGHETVFERDKTFETENVENTKTKVEHRKSRDGSDEPKNSGTTKLLGKRKRKNKLKTNSLNTSDKVKKSSKESEVDEEKDKRNLFELTKLEDNVEQVIERFKIGCECSDSNCFDGLNADNVFKHRLNIADLTKAEHDMYLMGVIMASVQNLEETCRHKERIRIRSSYAYQGKRVCLTAFLYLQHVTLYQMKRLRSHLKNHGVSPRIHGNRGRKPANTFSLDIYRRATDFIQKYIEKNCIKTTPTFTTFSSSTTESTTKKGNKVKIPNKMTSYHLPAECSKKTVHEEYKAHCENLKPHLKVMKYSTFTSFLKKQFPNVKFHKTEKKPEEKNQEMDNIRIKEEESVDKSIQTVVYIPGLSVQPTFVVIPKESQMGCDGQDIKVNEQVFPQVVVGNQFYDLTPGRGSDQVNKNTQQTCAVSSIV